MTAPAFSADAVDPGARRNFRLWLEECASFRVDSPGRRIGIVANIRRDAAGAPVELVVLAGVLGRKRVIGVDDVAQIVPRESRVVLRRHARIETLDAADRRRTAPSRRTGHAPACARPAGAAQPPG